MLKSGTSEYIAIHDRVRQMRGSANSYTCVDCSDPALDWAHITGTDQSDPTNYEPRCRSCHMRYDWATGARVMDDDQRQMRQEIMQRVRYEPVGVANGNAKLTDDDVREIRFRYAAGGVSQSALGQEYGVTQPMIGYIVRRELWKHI